MIKDEANGHWAYKKSNKASLINAQKNAFKLHMIRFDQWRFFCQKTEYKLLEFDHKFKVVDAKEVERVATAFNC